MPADDDVADDLRGIVDAQAQGHGGRGAGFPLLGFGLGGVVGFELALVGGDLVGAEDGGAGDGVGLVLLRGQEGDVAAEARGLDDEEVGAGARFFDQGDAVGGLGVAVELLFGQPLG